VVAVLLLECLNRPVDLVKELSNQVVGKHIPRGLLNDLALPVALFLKARFKWPTVC